MTSGGLREPWTPFADEVLATMYATQGAKACQRLLPGRTIMAIQQRASRLGVNRDGYAERYSRTPADDRPEEDKALDYVLRDFRECEPAANLVASLGVAA